MGYYYKNKIWEADRKKDKEIFLFTREKKVSLRRGPIALLIF